MNVDNKYKIIRALNLWNELTNPSVLRTDSEHRRCNKASKNVMKWIIINAKYDIHYKEMSNGTLIYI